MAGVVPSLAPEISEPVILPENRFWRRPAWACLIAGLLPVAVRLLLLPLMPVPVPNHHDEFSYLLGADTFAHGRVTNPPHALWVHFEALQVNHQPTYASKYPPAQALFLAFGQRFLGSPWAGVVLGVGLMCAGLCWMLQGWVSPPYALLASCLAALTWGVTDYWMNSYWGGAVAALGGALVIGAAPRLARRASTSAALLGAAGVAVLAASRPYEGLLTIVSTTAVLLVLAWSQQRSLRTLLSRRVILPAVLILLPAAAALCVYNARVTGSPFLLPYVLNERAYGPWPRSQFLPPLAKPVYRHELFSRVWDWENGLYQAARANPLAGVEFAWPFLAHLFVLNTVGVCALLGFLVGRKSLRLPALAILSLPLLGVLAQKAFLPHYLAPFCGAYLILAAAGLEACGRWRIGAHRAGPMTIALLCGITVGLLELGVSSAAAEARQAPVGVATRPLLIRRIEQLGGRHLVIVRYSPRHFIHEDWVYNRADIDGSPIVWARDMGEEKNRELLDYYSSRHVWLLEPDRDPLAIHPYPTGD